MTHALTRSRGRSGRRLSGVGLVAAAAMAATAVPATGWAQEAAAIDEILVTGSYIRRAPEDAPSPIRVLGRDEIEAAGMPQLGDFVRHLPSVVGSENTTSQEVSVGGAGAANINIRNLGLSSTLVLLDGKRLNVGTSISNRGEQFVDINRIPFIMVDNIEVLKDGASATFGSDAVAGVANFRLRNNFEGFEVTAMYQDPLRNNELNFDRLQDRFDLPERFRDPIDAVSGNDHRDLDLGAIWGFGNDRTHMVLGLNYFDRTRLQTLDRQFAPEYALDDSLGGPSPFNMPQDMFADGGLAIIQDSTCLAAGNYRTVNSGLCSTKADLLVRDMYSEETRWQGLATWTHQFNDQVEFYGHFGFAENEVTINQSPSFPLTAQPTFGTDHPGFRYEVENGPALAAQFGDDVASRLVPTPTAAFPFAGQFDPEDPQSVYDGINAVTFNGVIRPSLQALQEIAGIEQDDGSVFTHRNQSNITRESKIFMIGARGDLNDDWTFDLSYSFSDEDNENRFRDAVSQRVTDALNGFFGPDCDRYDPNQAPGEGDCTWFNPFGTSLLLPDEVALDGNGNEHTLGNDPEAIRALEGTGIVNTFTQLNVVEFVSSTNNFLDMQLDGGGVGFAIGAQYRHEKMSVGGNDLATDPSFPFTFTGPSIPFSASDDVWAIFTELALPVTQDLELQLALRYEDYGGNTGDTLDPKFAFRWNAMDELVLRGSVGTSFRGPSLNQRFGRSTGLQFMNPPREEAIAAQLAQDPDFNPDFGSGVFARLPSFGNPDLDPEKSFNFNIGAIWEPNDSFSFSVDYWNYRFEDIIVGDDIRSIINDCQIAWENAGRPAAQTGGSFNQAYLDIEPCNFRNLDGDASNPDIWLDSQGNPLTAQTSFTNGDKMRASGLDFLVRFSQPTDFGIFSSTLDFSWFLEFDADELVTPFDTRPEPGQSVDLVGRSEAVLVARPLPEYKATLFNDWSMGNHYATVSVNYVSSVRESNYDDFKVSDHYTVDASYTYNFEQTDLALTLGAVNLFDRDPPTANGGFNGYVPTLHDPRGRLWYVRARYRM